jgi:DNA-binding transcriptional LysR family regulator
VERRQLEYFLAVVEHGGFSKAARALHVAQPSLSHTIAGLEAEVGGALFHRLPHGVVLTAAGEALVEPAQQTTRDLYTALSSVRKVLGLSAGRLDIVAQTSLAVDPLAGMLSRFLAAHPKVAIRVSDPERGWDVADIVRSGACELGLVSAALPVGELAGIELAEQELRLVLPPGTDEPASGVIGSADLAELSFVATTEGDVSREVLQTTLRCLGHEPRIAVETAHRAMLVPLVLAGAGAALLPGSMADDAAAKGAVVCATKPAAHYRGRLVWRSGPLSPAAATFVTLARTYYAQPPTDA